MGARAGIRDGETLPLLDVGAAVDCERGFARTVWKPVVGVLDRSWEGGGPLTVAARLAGADFVDGARDGIDGVFERGGGCLDCMAAISSRYLSPKTKNGRPYSSSQASRTFFSSASTLGSSLAMRLRIFSSRSRRVGSRFSPFWPRSMRRDPSCWLV